MVGRAQADHALPRAIIRLLVVGALLAALAPAAAQTAAFGKFVIEDHTLATPIFLPATFTDLCYHDLDLSGAQSHGDPIYLQHGGACTSVSARDVRLVPHGGQQAGTQVRTLHDDHGLSAQASATQHLSVTTSGLLYLDVDDNAAVSPSDLRISNTLTYTPGSFVLAGDADLGVPLASASDVGVVARALDTNGDRMYSMGDSIIADLDSDDHASPGDVALDQGLYHYGDRVDATLERARVTLHTGGFVALCRVDGTVYVATRTVGGCSGTVRDGDQVLSGTYTGTKVATTDPLWDRSMTTITPHYRYIDSDGDLARDATEPIYLTFAPGNAKVTVGDLRLSSSMDFATGSLVASGHADVDTEYQNLGLGIADLRTYHLAHRPDASAAHARVALDVDQDGIYSIGDLHLSREHRHGSHALFAQDPVTLRSTASPYARLCVVDSDGNGSAGVGEPLYAVRPTVGGNASCGTLRAGDLRLSGASLDVGQILSASSSQIGEPLVTADAQIRYYDANGDGVHSHGDVWYATFSSTGSVAVGDVRLTSFGSHAAGTFVQENNTDINVVLQSTSGTDVTDWRAFDLDGDNDIDNLDTILLTPGSHTPRPAYGDVHLSRYGPFGLYGINGEPEQQTWETDNEPPTTTTPSPTPTSTPTSTPAPTNEPAPTTPTTTPATSGTSTESTDGPDDQNGTSDTTSGPDGGPDQDPPGGDGRTGPNVGGVQGALLAAGTLAVLGAGGAALVLRRQGKDGSTAAPTRAVPGHGEPEIDLRNVQVTLGKTIVLSSVTFQAHHGTINLLLGRSGSGKSTLVRAMVGLVHHAGVVRIHGSDHIEAKDFGYVPQKLELPTNLTPLEACALFGRGHGLSAKASRERGRTLLARLGIEAHGRTRLDRLSGGQQRRASIAVAMVHQPPVLILDEPTSGLDFAARKSLWVLLQDLARRDGITLLASTHFLDDVDYADQVGILEGGRVVSAGSPADLVRGVAGNGRCLEFEFDEPDVRTRRQVESVLATLEQHSVLVRSDVRPFVARCYSTDPTRAMPVVQRALAQAGVRVQGARVADVRIDDVFLIKTGHTLD